MPILHCIESAMHTARWNPGLMVIWLVVCIASVSERQSFGESMFANATDASKIAVAALVCFCRKSHPDD